jgi:Tfp pilus assembly protein PilF
MGALFAASPSFAQAQPAPSAPDTNGIRVVLIQGSVEVLPAHQTGWRPARVNQRMAPLDRIHTADNSRVALCWSDQSVITFGASTELEILPPETADAQAGLHLIGGITSFFHRDKPGRLRILTRGAMAGVEGTEFVLAVDAADRTTLSVIDGRVRFGNDQATLLLTNAQEATVELGRAPVRTAGFIANNLLQWCFYYPAVLDPAELPLTAAETNRLAGSLAAYRAGNLPAALAQYPAGRPGSDAERLYHAAVLLSVGEVAETETILAALTDHSERTERLAGALRQLIAAVKRQPAAATPGPRLASEYLAGSYFEQSRAVRETSLPGALRLARQATVVSPNFGFAWERLAELEFSFGRTDAALADLNRSLVLAPLNAQALALKGFVLSAENNPRAARGWFDRAIAADAALGNAWLGRGLARIRLGDSRGGREDLLVAAALEPQRAELRSYLGKAYTAAGDDVHATRELALAKKLDPNDPTAWLYSALLDQQDNQINDAIRDLEKSQSLNDNRSVYRSQLLLDQDSAVRSANLAGIYKDAGMLDTSVNEAGRAVSSDYGNYSAHLFLASSFYQMRPNDWSDTRYDTAATDEFWIANLLAPTGAGWLSPTLAEQPHARLFDQDRFGAVSDTTYLSRGAWTEDAGGFYTSDKFSFDVETHDYFDPGQRSDEDFDQREVALYLKGQLSPKDSLFGAVQWAQTETGDTYEYYNQSAAATGYRLNETEQPDVYLGYHHEWSPGVQTLFLAQREVVNQLEAAPNDGQFIGSFENGGFDAVHFFSNVDDFGINNHLYSTELQQIWEQENHTTIIGLRYDWGEINYNNWEENINNSIYALDGFVSSDPLITQNFNLDYHHVSLYGYHTWQIADPFSLTAGLSYDLLHRPADTATPPFADQETSKAQISPKAGFIWTPAASTVFRAAYTRSLSDLGSAQVNQLEPTEVAGFVQAYRSLIPESANTGIDPSGSRFDTFDTSLEEKFPTGTYVILSAEALYSKLNTLQGDFVYLTDSPLNNPPITSSIFPLGLEQSLYYRERTAALSVNQLLGKQWTVGAKYSLSQAHLDSSYPQIPGNLPAYEYDAPFQQSESLDSVLQTVTLHANWNHPSGLFSQLESDWYHQSNSGFSPAEPGDAFWQLNALAGYRFCHRKVEFTVGVLNLTDQNYQLEPLNLYNEMARSRTFLARLLISF